jgi:hypothetical protein
MSIAEILNALIANFRAGGYTVDESLYLNRGQFDGTKDKQINIQCTRQRSESETGGVFDVTWSVNVYLFTKAPSKISVTNGNNYVTLVSVIRPDVWSIIRNSTTNVSYSEGPESESPYNEFILTGFSFSVETVETR